MTLSQALNAGKHIPADALRDLALPRYGYDGDLQNPAQLADWLRRHPQCDVAVRELVLPVADFGRKKLRPEQAAFRREVIRAYGGKCAITGTAAEPALEAAHLPGRSHEQGHNHARDGILLRADLHKLLDAGWMSIAPDGTVRFHRDPGDEYAPLNGKKIRLPQRIHDRPAL